MRTFFAVVVSLFLLQNLAQAQVLTGNGQTLDHGFGMGGPPVAPRQAIAFQPIMNINGQDGIYLKKDLYLYNSYTILDGEWIIGTPYLFLDWSTGSLTTADGRLYSNYKLKYNVYNQAVSFLNGKDSLDVNEPVREFVLINIVNDTTVATRFVNANQYNKKDKNFYYEVIIDNEKGQLLKTNKKVVTAVAQGLLTSNTKKYLDLTYDFYYFDKVQHKITKLKSTGNNIQSVLELTDEVARELNLNGYDFSKEEDVISFMAAYFSKSLQQNKKGF